ncbi:DUF1223 domain-containing protein [Dichotomicrobium thermohalophilum]|uniref:DUF1223 domain-containing protein n=1 Tax=Dichotomicrobium thermohalophilum TaxID=933063 RepID=UPI001475439B|nr:DUF1223 domain-containing protein [Dichotomicrobium thermohalophilum]
MTRALVLCPLIALAACLAMLSASDAKAQKNSGPVVVELFTSQACSACPPADRLLGELAERDDVIALSLPVDYWDHLDWKDTLGRAEHSERQRRYARHLDRPNVYTPQIVVNGHIGVIGSRADAVQAAIRTAHEDPKRVPVEIEAAGKMFRLQIGAAEATGPADIIVVPLRSASTVAIKRGENRGKTITYHNVSRGLKLVGTWRGKPRTLTLSHDTVMTPDADRCAVILQDSQSGAILGAALLEDA